ncbi:MAG: hypothetical protein M1835_002561 [Candelina submexicana]|nr:MAG: hypothetical protein M1835_002561 [Candelina submexicana]
MRTWVSTLLSLLLNLPCLFPFVASTPTPQAATAVPFDCNKRDQTLRPECWDVLNVSQYLIDWADANKDCIPAPVGLDPHPYNEKGSFWDCFFARLKPVVPDPTVGFYNFKCTVIGSDQCASSTNITVYAPRDQYVILTIFNINQWFKSIYTAIGDSQTSVMAQMGSIVQLYNPPKQESAFLSGMLVAVGAAIGSLPFPFGGEYLSKLVFTPAMQQFPGILKYTFPRGTVDSRVTQQNQLNSQLDWLVLTTQDNMAEAMKQALDRWDIFHIFSQGGAFLGEPASSLEQRKNLTISLNTFAISQLLKTNNIYLTVAFNTNVKELADNGTAKYPEYVQCQEYDQHNVCNAWWYDAQEDNTYGLQRTDDVVHNYHDEMVTTFDQGWTTPELLFRGAKQCADYVYAGGDPGTLIDPNSVEPRCLSSLPLCLWDQNCWHTSCMLSGSYIGADCPAKSMKFDTWDCNLAHKRFIPPAYLGPILQMEKVFICRNG